MVIYCDECGRYFENGLWFLECDRYSFLCDICVKKKQENKKVQSREEIMEKFNLEVNG